MKQTHHKIYFRVTVKTSSFSELSPTWPQLLKVLLAPHSTTGFRGPIKPGTDSPNLCHKTMYMPVKGVAACETWLHSGLSLSLLTDLMSVAGDANLWKTSAAVTVQSRKSNRKWEQSLGGLCEVSPQAARPHDRPANAHFLGNGKSQQ